MKINEDFSKIVLKSTRYCDYSQAFRPCSITPRPWAHDFGRMGMDENEVGPPPPTIGPNKRIRGSTLIS